MNAEASDVALYALMLVLPIAALIARRPPLKATVLALLAWVAIFAVGLMIAGESDRIGGLFGGRSVEGSETRIAIADDGHFWAEVTINGVGRRMLVDSGATTTAISTATAQAAGIEADGPFPVMLNTANGPTTASRATAAEVRIGSIVAHDLPVIVSRGFGNTDMLGMNFLSRLASWRVEDRTLVLVPTGTST